MNTERTSRGPLLIVTISLLAALGLGLWVAGKLIATSWADVNRCPQAVVTAAELAVAWVQSEVGHGTTGDGLTAGLERLVSGGALEYVCVLHEQTVVAEAGPRLEGVHALRGPEGVAFRGGKLAVWRSVVGDSEQTEPAGVPVDQLVLVYDPAALIGPGNSDGELLLVVLVLTCLGATLLALTLSLVVRNGRLQRELRLATDRRVQVQELVLAAAGLAHETKNPLGIIRGLAQQIADDGELPSVPREKAQDIMEEADVTAARLGDFLNYARLRDPDPSDVPAVSHIVGVCNLIREDFVAAGIDLRVDVSPVTIRADAEMLSQVLLNLLNNSLRSTESSGLVTVSLKSVPRRKCVLTVVDTGHGIPPDFLPHIFKPYASGSREGHGIGLAIVKRIIDRSGWRIRATSSLGVGTTIDVSDIEAV
ncbi:MAG: HAMP domain-containing histidine kinase [Lentisphaerae bacterium]|nr:HAMP domain-containing histidine kinase [Lentisphaerota bacterium]MBT4819877.1 HAMP domain-containing histidine kinase [Lentisphaerota bacterium]MBT5605077.1 HAMP domain-containing histidine kinase [Lentisphaerota bacterium]MBT7062238.1 HAMP domain-containing histidine kinase [Lentisphaerota bacterium]MBT7847040.1 HAMP domain-containing histidine kinase [Lentisphaerota bacterium]